MLHTFRISTLILCPIFLVGWGEALARRSIAAAIEAQLESIETPLENDGDQGMNKASSVASDIAYLQQPVGLLPSHDIAAEFARSASILQDSQVTPSQSLLAPLGPLAQTAPFAAVQQPNLRGPVDPRPAVLLGLASVPFMLGDTGAGTCFSLRGIITADISHPSMTCHRLNVSENNTALPVDRVYYSYRHFNNSNGLQVFQYRETFDLDVHTLGTERTFWDGMGSVEMRLPIEYRLRSDIISLIAPGAGVVDVITGDQDREAGIGNLAFITKFLLMERPSFILSGGMGVTVPTSSDVDYDIGVQDTIIFPIAPGVTGDTLSTFENTYFNETVYLSPFMSWLWVPSSRWYHQGFLQVEVAANPSTYRTDGGGVTDFFFNGAPIGDVVYRTPGGLPTDTNVFAQTLLRANLGVGYRLTEANDKNWFSNLRALFEFHYTTTLQDGILSPIAIEQIGTGAFFEQSATAGNANRRADVLNAATGLSANVGRFIVTNGVVAPIRTGNDRGFDFEYNCQVQLPY